jgi:hypothetical protein
MAGADARMIGKPSCRMKAKLGSPKVRAAIPKGDEEFLAGKTRPIGESFAGRAARDRKRARR